MPTMYNLDGKSTEDTSLADEFNCIHVDLLSETCHSSEYDVDRQSWLLHTIDHLYKQSFNQVDWENLLEELKSLAVSERRELQKRLRIFLTYLLKYRYQLDCSDGCLTIIVEQFRQTESLLLSSPSLKAYYLNMFTDCYRIAVRDVSLEGNLSVNCFPTEPPFSPQELLNTDFIFSLMNDGKVNPPHISVVIPVYKAERCLQVLYERLKISLENITQDFEIILVEDFGGDRSWDIIVELAKADPRVKEIQFSRNFGQHYGITAGLDHCDGDWVVVMDCDLQDRPEEIPRLYAKAKEGYDIVLARRGKRKDSPLKRLTSWLFYQIFNYFTELKYDGQVGNFRIISRQVVENFCLIREQLRFFGGLVDWMGFPTASIDIRHEQRFEGKSTYTFAKLWKLASETIIAYSDKPLRLSIKLGFIISTLSFIYGIYIAIRVLFYSSPVTGWSSLIVSLYFLGGVIVSILGILGVYLGKTFDEIKKRPLYLVRNKTNNLSCDKDEDRK